MTLSLRGCIAAALLLGLIPVVAVVGMLGGPPAALALLSAAGLLGAASAFALPDGSSDAPGGHERVSILLRVLLAAAALLLLTVWFDHALRLPDGAEEAWLNWNARARALVRSGGDVSTALGRSAPGLGGQEPIDDSLLLPGLVSLGFWISGGESPWVPAAVSASFAALCLAVLALSVARRRGRTRGLLAALALATTPLFVALAVSETAELPLATYLLCASALAAAAAERQGRAGTVLLAVAGAALGLAAWTRETGLLLCACFCASVALERRRDGAAMLLGALPLLLLLGWFKLGWGPAATAAAVREPSPALARPLFMQARSTALLWLQSLASLSDWGIHLALAAAAALYLLIARRFLPGPRTVLRAGLLAVALEIGAQLLLPAERRGALGLSAGRAIFQLWPALLFALFCSLPGGHDGALSASAKAWRGGPAGSSTR